jgi:Tfp pilus assembly protein PilF
MAPLSRPSMERTQALEINPNYAEAYSNRARAYAEKKEFDKAWDDIHQAQALGLKVDLKLLQDLRQASGREN